MKWILTATGRRFGYAAKELQQIEILNIAKMRIQAKWIVRTRTQQEGRNK